MILFELKLSQPLSPHCDCDCDLVDVADCDRGEVDLWQGCSCVFNWGHRLLLSNWFFAEQMWPFKDFSYKSLINSAIWILCGSSNTWMNPKYLDELKIPGWSQNTWMNSKYLDEVKIPGWTPVGFWWLQRLRCQRRWGWAQTWVVFKTMLIISIF